MMIWTQWDHARFCNHFLREVISKKNTVTLLDLLNQFSKIFRPTAAIEFTGSLLWKLVCDTQITQGTGRRCPRNGSENFVKYGTPYCSFSPVLAHAASEAADTRSARCHRDVMRRNAYFAQLRVRSSSLCWQIETARRGNKLLPRS